MTMPVPLPHLALAPVDSPFDEAVIEIDDREEETILIDCPGAVDLAERLVAIVNGHAAMLNALRAATHALRSYEFGNGAPDLARSTADHCQSILSQGGLAA